MRPHQSVDEARRLPRALIVLAIAAVATTTAGASALTGAAATDVALATQSLPALHPGQTAWVTTLWRGVSVDATSFKLTATPPPGVTVSYPASGGTYSSLYKESTLLADDTDYAALKITVAANVSGVQTIGLDATYTLGNDGNGKGNNGNGNGNGNNGGNSDSKGKNGGGVEQHQHLTVTVPVVAATGDAAIQTTTTVGPIKTGTAQWVQVSYTGVKPGVTGVALRVTEPHGAAIAYPGSGTSSSLRADTTLDVGETDSAALKVDAAALAPGTYKLGLSFDYGAGQHLPETLDLIVSP